MPMPASPCPDRGFFTVSSTDRMRHVASEAAVIALIFTTEGSKTHAAKLSAMSSLLMSTPYQVWPYIATTQIYTSARQREK